MMVHLRSAPINRIVLTVPLILCSGVIYWLSSIPALTPPNLGVTWSDKVYHATAFLGYGWCVAIAVMGWREHLSARAITIIVISWGACFGMSDEFHQSMVVNRSAGWDDVAADVVGAALSTTAIPLLRRLLARTGLLAQ